MVGKDIPLCKLHPDFHLPANVKVGECFDGKAYAQRARDVGTDCLVHYAKDHYGHAYYPTKIGTMHPGLNFDMLKEFVSGCKEAGISPSVDYSVFLDTAAVRAHPDWVLQETPHLSPEVFEQKYLPVCVNSGYLEEMLIPQTIELIEQYDIDELFFDTMSDFIPCYCSSCAQKFGKPIPLNKECADWPEYVRWYVEKYDVFFDRILQVVHELRPEIEVVVNWRWSATLPVTPAKHVKRLVGDLFTSPSLASYFTRYWAGTGYPFDYMCGRFLHGLGDWSSNTEETLKGVAASTVANGGGFYIIDRQLPDGTLEDRSYPLLNDVFAFLQARRPVLSGATHLRETAVLHSQENIIGGEMEYFPDIRERENRLRPLKAVSRIFLRSGKHYTALNTRRLLEVLGDYRILILPEIDFLEENALAAIRGFAENGGSVLIVQSGNDVPVHEGLTELAGVKYCGRARTDYCYINHMNNGVSEPILVRGHFALVEALPGTDTDAALIAPWCEGGADTFGHGFAPPAEVTGYAAITRRKVGEGVVAYIAGPMLTSYFTHINPHIASTIADLYDRLLPQPVVKLECKGQVELAITRKDKDLIVHLINHSGKETIIDSYMHVTEYVPTVGALRLSVNCDGNTDNITLEPEGARLRGTVDDGYCTVTIPELHIMTSCRISNYFQ